MPRYISTAAAIAQYRASTAASAPSSPRYICDSCHVSRNIAGRKSMGKVCGSVLYMCEICQKAGKA